MPLYVNELCIGLHSKCNWRCKYCVARWDNAVINEIQILDELLPITDKLKTLWLSGGEPGLLSVQFWDYLFYITKCSLKICTNGTFIRRGYVDRYYNLIQQLMIHCVEEIDQDIDPYILQFIRETNIDTIVNIVIHKNNPHLIGSFLSKYPDIKFVLNFADQSFAEINKQYNKKYDFTPNKASIIETIKQLSKFKGYDPYINFLTKNLIRNNFTQLNCWSNKNHD